MVKKLFLVLCAILTLMACEKVDLTENGEDVKFRGNLTVRVFRMDYTPFADATRTQVADVCSRLNFVLYDADGARVKQFNQVLGDADYGTASFQLEGGDYFLVVVGHNSSGNPTMSDPSKIQFTNATGYSDTFLYASKVQVGDEPVALDVSLDRIVALCRFVVTDDIPADVSKMQFYYTGGSGAFNAATGLGCVSSKQTVTYDVTADQKQFDLYTFLHDTEGTIHLTVTALDASGNALNERQFDVPLYQNQITWLSGAFFDASDISSSSVSAVNVNAKWNGELRLNY